MLANTTLMRYAKGTCIHNGDNDCKGMLIVKNGILRTYMLSENGKELLGLSVTVHGTGSAARPHAGVPPEGAGRLGCYG